MPAKFRLPPLPYAPDSFGETLSKASFEEHHGGHHQGYVDKLNELAADADMADEDLITLIRETADADPEDVSAQVSSDDLFVNAAQHFNHCFFWRSLTPEATRPAGALAKAIERDFGSLEALKAAMVEMGAGHFASGWLWLVAAGGGPDDEADGAPGEDGELMLMTGHDAQTPVIAGGLRPLLVIDLWEHAYYLDHQRQRKAYLDALVDRHLDWDFAARALAAERLDDLDLGIANG